VPGGIEEILADIADLPAVTALPARFEEELTRPEQFAGGFFSRVVPDDRTPA